MQTEPSAALAKAWQTSLSGVRGGWGGGAAGGGGEGKERLYMCVLFVFVWCYEAHDLSVHGELGACWGCGDTAGRKKGGREGEGGGGPFVFTFYQQLNSVNMCVCVYTVQAA